MSCPCVVLPARISQWGDNFRVLGGCIFLLFLSSKNTIMASGRFFFLSYSYYTVVSLYTDSGSNNNNNNTTKRKTSWNQSGTSAAPVKFLFFFLVLSLLLIRGTCTFIIWLSFRLAAASSLVSTRTTTPTRSLQCIKLSRLEIMCSDSSLFADQWQRQFSEKETLENRRKLYIYCVHT